MPFKNSKLQLNKNKHPLYLFEVKNILISKFSKAFSYIDRSANKRGFKDPQGLYVKLLSGKER